MIALLTGRIASRNPDAVILDVNGVGYRVQIPFSTFYALPDNGTLLTLNIIPMSRRMPSTCTVFSPRKKSSFSSCY